MSYAEHNLISGETVTYRGSLHTIVLARTLLATVLLDLLAIGLIVIAVTNREIDAAKFAIPAMILLMISALVGASGILSRRCSEFVVTNKRVIVKTGVIRKQTAEIFLNKIETVGVDQTLAGRALGYGTISIHGTGGTCEEFIHIANPFEFRRNIQEQIGALMGKPAAINS